MLVIIGFRCQKKFCRGWEFFLRYSTMSVKWWLKWVVCEITGNKVGFFGPGHYPEAPWGPELLFNELGAQGSGRGVEIHVVRCFWVFVGYKTWLFCDRYLFSNIQGHQMPDLHPQLAPYTLFSTPPPTVLLGISCGVLKIIFHKKLQNVPL